MTFKTPLEMAAETGWVEVVNMSPEERVKYFVQHGGVDDLRIAIKRMLAIDVHAGTDEPVDYTLDFDVLDKCETKRDIIEYAVREMGFGLDQFGYTDFEWHRIEKAMEGWVDTDMPENWPAVAADYVWNAANGLDEPAEYIKEYVEACLRAFCPIITDDQIATCMANAVG